ncbi:MAG: hypothetical protein KAK00_08850, partial [Nanoarchaeota archaeon]|nr:hypothetical protein [Nanoarchaeota archaeon]
MDNELELLIEPDFLIREQSLLLSRFEGLNIDSTCGSHIRTEEWIPHNDREGSYLVLYYFILGLDRVINRKDSENDTVTNYEYYGQEINREVFGDGVRRPADEFMFLPFDDIHGHLGNPKIQQLYFDCPHLYFKKLDTSITDNKKLESGLLDLYEKYEALTDLVIVPQYYPGFRINN